MRSKTQEAEFGKLGWVMDPEGQRVEHWEPPQGPFLWWGVRC